MVLAVRYLRVQIAIMGTEDATKTKQKFMVGMIAGAGLVGAPALFFLKMQVSLAAPVARPCQ
jgi:hypothetical protein